MHHLRLARRRELPRGPTSGLNAHRRRRSICSFPACAPPRADSFCRVAAALLRSRRLAARRRRVGAGGRRPVARAERRGSGGSAFAARSALAGGLTPVENAVAASLQTGLLDPIPCSTGRSIWPCCPCSTVRATLSAAPRNYDGAWLIGAVFLAALLMNLSSPGSTAGSSARSGALLGVLSRFASGGSARRSANAPLQAVRGGLRGRLRPATRSAPASACSA